MINGSALVYIRRRTKENMGWPSLLGVGAIGGGERHLRQAHLVTGGGVGLIVHARRLAEHAVHMCDVCELGDFGRFCRKQLGVGVLPLLADQLSCRVDLLVESGRTAAILR